MKAIEIYDQSQLLYLDESGFDNHLIRLFARAPRGQKVIEKISGKRCQRISVIAGQINKEIIAPFEFEGTCNSTVFNLWLEKELLPVTPKKTVIIMDNASFHKSLKTRELIEKFGCILIYLSPYSPELNPIESFWHELKSKVRKMSDNSTLSLTEKIDLAILNS